VRSSCRACLRHCRPMRKSKLTVQLWKLVLRELEKDFLLCLDLLNKLQRFILRPEEATASRQLELLVGRVAVVERAAVEIEAAWRASSDIRAGGGGNDVALLLFVADASVINGGAKSSACELASAVSCSGRGGAGGSFSSMRKPRSSLAISCFNASDFAFALFFGRPPLPPFLNLRPSLIAFSAARFSLSSLSIRCLRSAAAVTCRHASS
jgi:hypothetical protein